MLVKANLRLTDVLVLSYLTPALLTTRKSEGLAASRKERQPPLQRGKPMSATSPYLNLPLRDEPEVRRARLKVSLEKNKAVGRAEGLSDEIMDESNRDILLAFDTAEAVRGLFEQIGSGIK
jgi:hypothetical protein